jgi:hypothetical protein
MNDDLHKTVKFTWRETIVIFGLLLSALSFLALGIYLVWRFIL